MICSRLLERNKEVMLKGYRETDRKSVSYTIKYLMLMGQVKMPASKFQCYQNCSAPMTHRTICSVSSLLTTWKLADKAASGLTLKAAISFSTSDEGLHLYFLPFPSNHPWILSLAILPPLFLWRHYCVFLFFSACVQVWEELSNIPICKCSWIWICICAYPDLECTCHESLPPLIFKINGKYPGNWHFEYRTSSSGARTY